VGSDVDSRRGGGNSVDIDLMGSMKSFSAFFNLQELPSPVLFR
jgi:hypothetical protein